MKAHLRSVRIAPKKANVVAKMVRGMPVPGALDALRRTNKKAARLVEQLLRSAVANARHNDKQDPALLMVKTIVVNQAAGYRRGVPMSRGRMRPMTKFLSHISLTLGMSDTAVGADANAPERAKPKTAPAKRAPAKKSPARPSQTKKTAVQHSASKTKVSQGTHAHRSSASSDASSSAPSAASAAKDASSAS
jgi:large subunit ribosomal protein L22